MALYNNGFPATYQPVYYQPAYQAQPAPQTQPSQSGVIWVQGEAGAKSYLVAPNTTVQLWDSERQTIYLKSADASGMPSMKTLDYTIREMPSGSPQDAPKPAQRETVAYATKDDLKALHEQITALQDEINGLTIRRTPTRKKEADDE